MFSVPMKEAFHKQTTASSTTTYSIMLAVLLGSQGGQRKTDQRLDFHHTRRHDRGSRHQSTPALLPLENVSQPWEQHVPGTLSTSGPHADSQPDG